MPNTVFFLGLLRKMSNLQEKPPPALHTDKKEKKIFLIYQEIQKEAVAKSYMRKGFLIYEEIHIHI
jgi:hypothetical protein